MEKNLVLLSVAVFKMAALFLHISIEYSHFMQKVLAPQQKLSFVISKDGIDSF